MASLRKGLKATLARFCKTFCINDYENTKRIILKANKYSDKLVKSGKPILLEIGSGDKKGENGWTTLDYATRCDIKYNLLEKLPFPDNSVDKIYSSHVLEHFTRNQLDSLLQECKRILKPGGIFSVCVPNAKLYIDAYTGSKKMPDSFFQYKAAYNYASAIDYINYIAFMDGHHKHMFDEDNLVSILSINGFQNVKLREFQEDLDRAERDYESIYAECIK